MKRSLKHLLPIALLAPLHVQAAEVVKANNTNTLNLATSWVSGGPPGAGDIAVWDGPISSTLGSLLGTDGLSWAGIKVLSPAVATQIRNTAGFSLTLGSAGIDMAGATQNFTVAPNLILGSNQTWDVGSGRVLIVSNGVSGAGKTMTKSGAGTLRLTGTASTYTAGLQIGEGGVESAHTSGSQELAGPLSGNGALNKMAGGGLTISAGNGGFTGTLNLSAGQLNLNHAGALGGGTLNVTGGALDNTSGAPITLAAGSQQSWVGNFGFTGSQTLNLGGSTVTVDGSRTLTVSGGILVAGGMIQSHLENGGDLTKTGAGTLQVPAGGTIDMAGKLAVTGGDFQLNGGTVVCGISAGAFEIGGATVELNSGSLTTRSITRAGSTSILRLNGATLRPLADSFPFIGKVDSVRVSTGGARINLDGWYATIAPPLLHDAALGGTADGGLHVSDSFAGGVLTISGTNTYTGPTVIEAGTLVLASGASIASSPLIDLGAAGVFDAGSGTTMPAGQTLQGTGEVKGKLTVGAGATLSPGGDTVASMRFSQSLTLAGNAAFQIHKAGGTLTSDRVPGLESVTYGGNLTVTATGSALALGDRFVLFESLSYSGSFNTLVLPTLPGGMFWEVSSLPVDGSIKVVNTLPQPVFTPPAGSYFESQSVTITGMSGSTIHYTTDGSDPLTSGTRISAPSPVTGVIVPDGSTGFVIKAYASQTGFPNSTVASAEYAIVDTGVWTLDGSGNWSEVQNWLDGLVARGVGVTADFSQVERFSTSTATLDSSRVIGHLKFGEPNAQADFALQSTGGSVLTLDAGPDKPVIHVGNGTATITASLAGTNGYLKTGTGTLVSQVANAALGGAVLIREGDVRIDKVNSLGAGAITLGDATSGANEIRLLQSGSNPWPPVDTYCQNDIVAAAGPTGRVVIARANAGSYAALFRGTITLNNNVILRHEGGDRMGIEGKITGTGNVTLEGTRINVDNNDNDFVGNVTVTAGCLMQINGNGVIPVTSDVTADGTIGFNTGSATALSFGGLNGTGTVNVSYGGGAAALNIGAQNRDGDFAGVIASSITVTKGGTGRQILSGASTYSGGTTIAAGTLLVNNTSGSGTGTGAVAANSGATLGGSGTIGGNVTVNGGATLAPGDNGAGTLASGPLVLAGTYQCQLDGSTADKLAVNGNLTLTGSSLVVSPLGPAGAGPFVVATYTGTRTGTFANVTAGYSVVYDNTNKQVLLTTSGGGDPFDTWAASAGLSGNAALKTADPDGDGFINLLEFATNSNPNPASGGGSAGPRVYPLMFTIGADKALTYTIAVRKNAAFSASGSAQTAIMDQVKYTVEASNELTNWKVVPVAEVTGQTATDIRSALGTKLTVPPLGADWEWHTFRTDGGSATDPNDFIRLKVEEAAF